MSNALIAALLIMLREGLEASLIVVIIAAYLKKTGRPELIRPMWIGVAGATALCLAVGVAINRAGSQLPQDKQELLEAVIGFAAVGVLTWMIFWMRKAGRSMKGELESKVDAAIARPGRNVSRALVAMAFFAVLREGMESVLFLLAAFQQDGRDAAIGAVVGVTLSIVLAYLLYKGSVHLDLRKFFTITGAVIIVFAAGLLARSVRSLHEAGVLNVLTDTAWDTSDIMSNNGPIGSVLRVLIGYQAAPSTIEVIVYWAYLVPTALLFLFGGRRKPATASTATVPADRPTDTTTAAEAATMATAGTT